MLRTVEDAELVVGVVAQPSEPCGWGKHDQEDWEDPGEEHHEDDVSVVVNTLVARAEGGDDEHAVDPDQREVNHARFEGDEAERPAHPAQPTRYRAPIIEVHKRKDLDGQHRTPEEIRDA